MRIYPNAQSRVVRVAKPGAIASDLVTVSPEAVGHMLDAAIARLTGLDDPASAWGLLFDPGERIAIKVNTIAGSFYWTRPTLVLAVVERLQAIGVPPSQITIFDRRTGELRGAGYSINQDGAGVRCYGTDGRYGGEWVMMDTPVALSEVLLGCDALINMPLLKSHGIAGISFSMKNHYGTFDKPASFHGGRAGRGMAELNALPPIRERTRLIIGDALTACTRGWRSAVVGDMLLASFDPVAIDAIALQTFEALARDDGVNPASALRLAQGWLANGEDLGLGASTAEHIDLMEVGLT
jgi:uncharacterized protein (DUF362 family)